MTLADRVAIMRNGLLQQVGAPKEIYERPANVFVGGFLGSPGMNFLRGVVQRDEEGLTWTTEGHRLALPGEWTSALEAARLDGAALLGIRPENVTIATEGDGAIAAEVYVAEALGNETLVRLQIGGQDLVARADASYEPAVGTRVWVRPDLRKAHLFDAASEARIV